MHADTSSRSTGRASNLLVWLAVVVLAVPAAATARQQNVEEWVAGELSKYVSATLSGHPRFKGAPVRFVVMNSGNPQSNVDVLSLRLRDRLQRQVIDTPGITVAWQPNGADTLHRAPQTADDCRADDVQYLIGIELRDAGIGDVRVSLRALDVIEKTWVAGFGKEWRGRLSRDQLHARRRPALDRAFLGERGVPYDHTESDLMAAHLAHELRCALMREVAGEYVVDYAKPDESADPDTITGILELVGNNVAGLSSLRFAVGGAQANALLHAEAHAVDADLHQYWVTITPTDADTELKTLSASVYAHLPDRYLTAAPRKSAAQPISVESGALFDSLRLVKLEASRSCPPRHTGYRASGRLETRNDCLGLEITTSDDAVVFVLNHQQNNGLVRLAGSECNHRTVARISRANEAITVALPTSLLRDAWLPENEWRLEPDADTYYAIAVSNSKAARAFAVHLDKLPQRCSESVRVGYEGRELASWLTALSDAVENWQPYVDWNAIKIKNVY